MILGFGNNVVSALAGDITAIQVDIPVMPGTGAKFSKLLSADFENKSNVQRIYAKITLTDNKESAFEICHLVSVSGDVLKVIRGQEGTTAKGWSLNDVVANFATRGSENHFVQIAQLQSGHYVAGVAGGTANALTLELPAAFFENGRTDWTLRTPVIVFPVSNNTGPATIQLVMGGRALGVFPLYKGGNQTELSANDIVVGAPLVCILDHTKTFFSVVNPGTIYSDLPYVKKDGDTMTGDLNLPNLNASGVVKSTGEVQAGNGRSRLSAEGDIYGEKWGNRWLYDYLVATYQPKGSYATQGQAYTKAESDARYIQNLQRGAAVSPGKINEYGPAEAPVGCFLTNVRHDPDTPYGVYTTYRPLQMYINNAWRTING